jgi:hypothetical protein
MVVSRKQWYGVDGVEEIQAKFMEGGCQVEASAVE